MLQIKKMLDITTVRNIPTTNCDSYDERNLSPQCHQVTQKPEHRCRHPRLSTGRESLAGAHPYPRPRWWLQSQRPFEVGPAAPCPSSQGVSDILDAKGAYYFLVLRCFKNPFVPFLSLLMHINTWKKHVETIPLQWVSASLVVSDLHYLGFTCSFCQSATTPSESSGQTFVPQESDQSNHRQSMG